MPTFYKFRGTELPTVIYNGDVFYDFVRVAPDVFEYTTTDPKVVKFLIEAGYPIKEETPSEVATKSQKAPVQTDTVQLAGDEQISPPVAPSSPRVPKK